MGRHHCLALCLLCLFIQQVVLKPQTHLLQQRIDVLATGLVGGQCITGEGQCHLTSGVREQVIHQ